ncbi:hypothetical protein Tco_1058450 [Tanacetum coccineum]|uniref:Uncharacterized protein n=1 Tax=Tanacetum coccineum TaxID=301880 RepID=A0ABQ5H8B6_9ASTR
MDWNLGPRPTSIESTQFTLRYEISALKQDTFKIKSIMIEIFKVFKGQSSLAPSYSMQTTTLAITEGIATVRGEKFTHAVTEEPLSLLHTKGENNDMETQETEVEKEPEKEITEEVPTRPTRVVSILIVRPITRTNPETAFIKSSSRPSLTNTILEIPIPQPTGLVIDITPPKQPKSPPVAPKADKGKGITTDETEEPKEALYQIINDEIQAHMDKKEKIKKADVEEKLLAMSKPKLIKIVQEEATKASVDPKILSSAKGGQEFKKIQDAKLKVFNREHS